MKRNIKTLLTAACILLPSSFCLVFGQATTLVKPRQYTLVSSMLLTNSQAINTNSALPGQTIGVFTNTLTPYSGTHPIGLAAFITCTNNLPGTSNVVINIYPAYDNNGGNTNGLNESYGTNFATVPIFTWNVAYRTNAVVLTNIASATWEPATSLGYTISNASASNIVLTLIQSQSP
jgi:hypothetical protein